jgi:hypothetical protein
MKKKNLISFSQSLNPYIRIVHIFNAMNPEIKGATVGPW